MWSRSSAAHGATPRPIFRSPICRTSLRYRIRHELFLRPSQMSVTFRNKASETALPVRNWGAFMLGNGAGGAGVHWNAETFRFLPSDFVTKSHLTQRYGANFLPADMTVQDWGVTYDDLEPHYDKFEYLCGTSGQAGNLEWQDSKWRQSVRRRALTALSDAANEAGLWSYAVRRSGKAARLQAIPATVGQSIAILHQPTRRDARPMHVLRLLRVVWLRQLFQGQPADHDPARARAQIEFRGAHKLRGDAHQPQFHGQARHRRDLCRHFGRGVRAAGRSRSALRLPALERAAAY